MDLAATKSRHASSSSSSKARRSVEQGFSFEIFILYRMDWLVDTYLTTILPRMLRATLRDFEASLATGEAVFSIPNHRGGAVFLGTVHVENKEELKVFLGLVENAAQRVFRTGLNERTISGNFRLPLKGIRICPETGLLYMQVDRDFPFNALSRFETFLKSLYFRLSRPANLDYEPEEHLQPDRLIIGKVEDMQAVDLEAFERVFGSSKQQSRDYLIGFSTFNRILVRPEGAHSERHKSVFYFDHVDHEHIISIENVADDTPATGDSTKNVQEPAPK